MRECRSHCDACADTHAFLYSHIHTCPSTRTYRNSNTHPYAHTHPNTGSDGPLRNRIPSRAHGLCLVVLGQL